MPWHLEKRESKWCVIKNDDGHVQGCHDSRAEAIKQQRALYAQESRMASMYDELDAQPIEEIRVPEPQLSGFAAELAALVLKDERERSLTASLAQSMETIAQRQEQADEERRALVAALAQVGQPIINVPVPEITVEAPPAPQVTVEVEAPQVTVQPPEVIVQPEITVASPDVTIQLPPKQKTVTFERDPLTREITKAEVAED